MKKLLAIGLARALMLGCTAALAQEETLVVYTSRSESLNNAVILSLIHISLPELQA